VLLLLAPVFAPAAERCSVSELVLGVPDGPAAWVAGGFQAVVPPVVHITTVTHSAGIGASATSLPTLTQPPTARGSAAPRPRDPGHTDQERLFAAAFYGDLPQVQRLLSSPSVNVNAPARSPMRASLIDAAAMSAQPQVIQVLIDHGARVRGPLPDVDVHPIAVAMLNLKTTVEFQDNPPALSVMPKRTPSDFEATVRVLLEAGADADGVLDPTHPQSALVVLLSTPRFDGDLRIARLLLDHGARLDAAVPGGSPLALAVAQGRDDFVDFALDGRTVDRSALDAALVRAVAMQNEAMVARFLGAGASPDGGDEQGRPMLCWRMFGAGTARAIAMLLLQHGARVDIDCLGAPPLNLVVQDRELALLMIDHGADPSRADRNGATALDLVADADHTLVDVILRHGGRLGQPSREAAYYHDMRVEAPGPTVRAILQHKDYVASRLLLRDGLVGDAPCAAVLYAAASGASATLAQLLRRGGDPNSMTEGGITALMAAAYHGEDDALALLLAQPKIDIDRTTPTKVNSRALTLYSEEAQPLRTGHRTALMYAAANGRRAGVTLLLRHGASVRKTDAEGLTASDYAQGNEARSVLPGAHP
jgi:ankyrin repeat protein